MRPSITLIALLLLCCVPAQAEIRVAFLEVRDYYGKIVEPEEGDRFAHVAISYGKGWLHAHPKNNVEAINCKKLSEYGKVKTVIVLEDAPALKRTDVAFALGKAYDDEFSWTDKKIYCSELVAKILGLPTNPMNFNLKVWGPQYEKYNGLPGISPDGVFRALKKQGYTKETDALCES